MSKESSVSEKIAAISHLQLLFVVKSGDGFGKLHGFGIAERAFIRLLDV